MKFVYNGKYLEYFEVGRTELLRNYGLPYRKIEEQGYQLPLLEAGITYKHAATYDDLIDIDASIQNLRSAKIRIEYALRRHETGEIVATGFTDHIFMSVATQKATRPPRFFIESLARFFE
jgi:acyl-CoA thioester hydrolase